MDSRLTEIGRLLRYMAMGHFSNDPSICWDRFNACTMLMYTPEFPSRVEDHNGQLSLTRSGWEQLGPHADQVFRKVKGNMTFCKKNTQKEDTVVAV